DNRRCGAVHDFLFLILIKTGHDPIGHFAAVDQAVARRRETLRFQPTIVAAQTLLKAIRGNLECQLRFLGLTCRLQLNAGIEADKAISGEAATPLHHIDVPGKAAIKVFLYGFADLTFDARAEGIANIHVLTRNAESHLDEGPSWPVAMDRVYTCGQRLQG